MRWRVRPLEFLGVDPPGAWTETDRFLAEALTLYERSLCGDCGHDKTVAWDDSADGWFEVDDSIMCHACAARERYQNDHKEKTPEPGVKIGVRLDPGYWEKER